MRINNINILFDINGNLYFEYNNILYDIEVTKDNELVSEKINHKKIIYDGKVITGELKNIYQGKSLKSYAEKNKLESELDFMDHYEEEENYMKEDIFYLEADGENMEEQLDSYVCFNHDKINVGEYIIKIPESDDSSADSLAIYETIVYKGTTDKFEPIFKTRIVGDLFLYRISLYSNGDIIFRPIGEREINYFLQVKNEIVVLNKK